MLSSPLPIHTIAIFPKIQADTAVAVYLLKTFGESAFPGISRAKVVFWTAAPAGRNPEEIEREGTLCVDLGGMFDHHRANTASGTRTECASTLIAKHLGIDARQALRKVLAWAKRDDLEGKGTISEDTLDRAFGLSGIIMNLNRSLTDTPQKTLDYVLPLIHYHVLEEARRAEELPREWEALLASGKAGRLKLEQGSAELKGAWVESDNIALPGFLRAAKRIDLIIQRRSSGHTNILTQQIRSVDLRPVIEALRAAEAAKLGVTLPADRAERQKTGKLAPVDMWYYDDAANTIQNGGVNPGDVPATRLALQEIIDAVSRSIPGGVIGALRRQKERELGPRPASPVPTASPST